MSLGQNKVPGFGPAPAKVMIIGEAPGEQEVKAGKPFVGGSGVELTRMLNDAGILRTECYVTNVCKHRPPQNNLELWWPDTKKARTAAHVEFEGHYFDARILAGLTELEEEVRNVKPNILVPVGNLALWATTRNTGILKWRSSLLHSHSAFGDIKVVPTIHPAAVLRNWEWRYLAVHDLRRVARWKDFEGFPEIIERFQIRPDFQTARSTLQALLLRVQGGEQLPLAVDIETRRRHIACLGIAWSRFDAICLPFICVERPSGYWEEEEEKEIVLLLRELLTHPNTKGIGQNWQYDYQYIAKYWGFEINLFQDIMTEHHVQWPGLPKGLDFQSSLYSDIHVYWKDEGKVWDKDIDEDQLWSYNCKDCVRTYECFEVLRTLRAKRPLGTSPYGTPFEIQQALSEPMARASARGVRVDEERRRTLAFVLQEDAAQIQGWINDVVKEELNVDSPKQMHQLFYTEMGIHPILNRKTKKPTLDDEALEKIGKQDVLLRPLTQAIQHLRSLHKGFALCTQELDADGRFRTQYTIPGAETYRFASSTDPFGYGGNGQNITSGDEENRDWPFPNLRKILIPDPGHFIGEWDLPQADARVVAWEAEDEDLKQLFRDPTRHLHFENAEIIFGKRPLSKHEINYYYAKQGVHLTNYGGSPQVLAATLGILVHEADRFQKRWFGAHPKIKGWHERILLQLSLHRYVENRFGYRRHYYDRLENLLKEALAWIPQSTVAVCTNLGIIQCHRDEELRKLGLRLLLQVHDSHVQQWPSQWTHKVVPRVSELSTITVPYDDPLILRPEVKISDKSWGDCEDYKVAA